MREKDFVVRFIEIIVRLNFSTVRLHYSGYGEVPSLGNRRIFEVAYGSKWVWQDGDLKNDQNIKKGLKARRYRVKHPERQIVSN